VGKNDPMQLRSATGADVDDLVALVESAYRGDASREGWTTEADLLDGQRTDAQDVLESLDHLVVAEDESGLVGCCALEPKGDFGYFGMFAVRPGTQGAGIGSRLLEEAERRAAEQGLRHVEMTVITVRTELLAYYLRRGYVDTGVQRPFPYGDERFGRPRRDDLAFTVLRKDL
jgi:N-acetylglutamate synthase-like GNAT family acetyltransferase